MPTYFSSILLLIAALLIGMIWALRNRTGKTYTFHWGSLAILFFLLSLDEVAGIHEMMNRPMRLMLNPTGFFAFAWVTLAIPVLIILGLFYFRFFLQLPKMMKVYIVVAAVLYIGGALGFEMITARHFELYDNENLIYILLVTVEETLEIIGALVFVYAFLQYFLDCYAGVRFRVSRSKTNTGNR